MPKCAVCGGTEFVEDGGFYYCIECQTICKDVINQVVDDVGGTMLSYTTKISSQRQSYNEYQWTTWEAYNYILKGMVDEVIELGASPEFKFVVLQLWARYLQELEVSFLRAKKPKLGPGFNVRDAKVVYSMSEEVKLVKKRTGSVHSLDSSNISKARAGTKAKKALAKAQYEQSINSSCDTSSISKVSVRRNTYLTKEAIYMENMQKNKRSLCKRQPWRIPCIKSARHVKMISRTKLLVIIYLGLRLCKDGIQLADLLRWIREGHLSYHTVAHFFPSTLVLKGKDGHYFKYVSNCPSHETVRKLGMDMVKLLGIETLPTPHWSDLIHRYTKELALPEELANFTIKLSAECPPRLQLKDGLRYKQYLPNYEGRAVALIIFAMKLLFGLDGLSEIKLSEFASKANKILSLGESAISENLETSDFPADQLFVWEDWVNYIEFRKSLLTRFHSSMAATDEAENMNLLRIKNDTIPPLPPCQGFFPYLKQLQKNSDKSCLNRTSTKDNNWTTFMRKNLEEIITEMDSTENDFHINFKPSLTPQYSYMKELQGHRMLREIWSKETGGICKLFDANFTISSLGYLFHEEQYMKALKSKGISVNVIKSSAFCENNAKHLKFVEPFTQVRDRERQEFVSVKLTDDKIIQEKEFPFISWNQKFKKIHHLVEDDDIVLSDRKSKNHQTKVKRLDCLHKQVKKITPRTNSEDVPEELTLFLPYRKVWMQYTSLSTISDETFSDLCNKFPCSFSWLLQLCSVLLEMDDLTLFLELVHVELMHKFRKFHANQEAGNSYKNIQNKTLKSERIKANRASRNW